MTRLSKLLVLLSSLSWLLACSRSVSFTPTPTGLAEELIFYNWAGDMPESVLAAFTAEFGVKVNYRIYKTQEEAIEKMRAGQVYDVVTIESRLLPGLAQAGLLAEIDYHNVPNFKNISANFRDLAYDPGNRYSIPYNWGTTGLVVRSDLVKEPVTHWAALWDKRYAGKTAIWGSQPREVIALTLKSLGYSANSEDSAELEAALQRLLEIKPTLLRLEDFTLYNPADVLTNGQVVITMGYAADVLLAREKNPAITYVLPKEGALLWGDTFVIPANSNHKTTAEIFLNFLMRAEINAEIANQNLYATPNEAAFPFIQPEILNDPVIFPSQADLKNAEIILPLTPEGQKLYDEIWERFVVGAE